MSPASRNASSTTEKPRKRRRSKTPKQIRQPEVNIGTIGHVDNGKSTLVEQLTGKFPDEHSEERKRGISIRLGYADADIRMCPKCEAPEKWTVKPVCPHCGSETKLIRRVSFVDAPGHEILMATMLSGAAIMDGAILVIAANEYCPQPQTREHLAAMEALGISNIVIAQNKIELVSEEEALENYRQIKEFVKGTIAKDAPIIPISAMHGANIDLLIQAIQERIPTPERDPTLPARMEVARSFEVNRPGTEPKDLKGGVLGGSLQQGTLRVGDQIEIVPGIRVPKGNSYELRPIVTTVVSLAIGKYGFAQEATAGGLLGVGTTLDPALTKADALIGNVISAVGHSPPVRKELTLEIHLLDFVVGTAQMQRVTPIAVNEPLMLNVGTDTTLGIVRKVKKNKAWLALKKPVAADSHTRVAISRRLENRFRLIGHGIIIDE